jgi:hypothetical protein
MSRKSTISSKDIYPSSHLPQTMVGQPSLAKLNNSGMGK